MLLCFFVGLFSVALSLTCSNDPPTVKALSQSADTVIYGKIAGSRLIISKVFKASQKAAYEFAEVSVKYEHARALPDGSLGVYFGKMEQFDSVFTVTCAVIVPDCTLESLKQNKWDICGKTTDHCWTAKGIMVQNGKTYVDYETGEQCTCYSGSLLCERGLCRCTEGSVSHQPGETWKVSTCKECLCEDKGGVCSYTCEEDICLALILPIVAGVLAVLILIGFIAYRSAKGLVLVDLEENLPGADYTPLSTNV